VPGFDSLVAYGWDDRWAEPLRDVSPEAVPGRVIRHHGTAVVVATPDGIVTAPLVARLDPAPTVGDWVALVDREPVAVLPRTSLLRRRAALRDEEQVLAANVDAVLLVCGLDRPLKAGRIQRGAALASEAGAEPIIVLTKASLADDPQGAAAELTAANPGLQVVVTSAREDVGLDVLRDLIRDRTVVLLGESGAGKSSIVNALLGEDIVEVGKVRAGDAKGRHTTTTRFLHLLPSGGTLIDSPGIRSIGLWGDTEEAVVDTFADVTDVADQCRFTDCRHDSEPGCAVKEAIADGSLTRERLAAWRALEEEASSGRRPRR
jgi:ribosome biogenesis GTPase